MHDWLFTNLGTFTWGSVENMRSAEYGEWKMRSVENEELCISVCFTFLRLFCRMRNRSLVSEREFTRLVVRSILGS